MSGTVKYDLSKLNTLVKSLDDKHAIRVGIFGNKNARKDGAETNASVGFLHEYGSVERHIPPRSFLRMPLAMKGAQVLKEVGPSGAKLLGEGKVILFMKRIGIACENVIQGAFATRGYGAWKKNAPSTIKRKGSDSPLIDTAQLRRSITSKVVNL